MKALVYFVLLLVLSCSMSGQAPIAFTYQGVASDNFGQPLSDQLLGIEISILKSDPSAAPEYVETHHVRSSSTGHFSIEVGRGTYVSGSSLSTIATFADFYSLAVSIDITGGENYVFLGASELLSVP